MAFERVRERLENFMTGKKSEIEAAADQTEAEKDIVGYVRNEIEEIRSTANRIISEGS
jgi:hypothetical protein